MRNLVNFKDMKKNKVLIWGLAIAGIGLAGYVIYSMTKKTTTTTNQPLISSSTISNIANGISGLFSKKSTVYAMNDTGITLGDNYPTGPNDQLYVATEEE
jgi:hypothetical protein